MNDAPDTPAAPASARDYRQTVFLPRTDFPMRADLPRREPALLAQWEAGDAWGRLRAASKGRPPFVLHDGPPYANGPLHIGHALNKILKDVVNRAAQMAGYDADYVPGWDCHGLPIEWKVEEEYRNPKGKHQGGLKKEDVPVLEFRAECRAYAQKWLDVQREEFKRLGVAGDWARRYATMDFASEAVIVGEIGRFLLNSSLYRGLRPVMWSPVEKTALAEAEIEYADHVSHTLWARFPVAGVGRQGEVGDLIGASLVAWTTTPWTIPANRALAVNPELEYVVVHVGEAAPGSGLRVGERLVVALKLLPDFAKASGLGAHVLERVLPGAELVGCLCRHPFGGQFVDSELYEAWRPVLAADFVTDEAGAGVVHIAPDHGEDDFVLGRANGLPPLGSLNDDGTYAERMTGMAGLHVFRAHARVYELCEAAGTLIAKGSLTHSYPHSWRSKKPVIFRATPQWFIAMDDDNAIRARALGAIGETRFIPDAGRNRLGAMVAGRPDWCISRQRAWGVPIAVFVEKRSGEVLRDAAVMARIVAAFEAEGADCWYRPGAAARFLGEGRNADDYEQVMDIVDVWFESGCTHSFVLEARGMPTPADLYLEGSDQHRGWFQSSLLESVGSRGVAPFKAVLTHGFVLDEAGRKMSKSLGNVTAPQEVTAKYGADILRLWVMNSDTAEDLRIGKNILEQQAELYRRIRNTLRWLLGSLDGFTEAERVPVAQMPELERWVLHRLSELDARVRGAVASHDWSGVVPELHNFCATDLSAFFFDIRKDSLYCDAVSSPKRRAARTVLDALHRCLAAWLAPVLVFTAEEAWQARFPAESVHARDFPEVPAAWRDEALAAKWGRVRELRRVITTAIEKERAAGTIGSSLQAAVELRSTPYPGLLGWDDWAEICIVSSFESDDDEVEDRGGDRLPAAVVNIVKAPGSKCERCWRVLPEVAAETGLCRRCEAVVA